METPNKYEELISALHRIEDNWPIELAFIKGRDGLYLVNQHTNHIIDFFAINSFVGYCDKYWDGKAHAYSFGNGVIGGGD
jgi:hypothetical protein